MKLFIAPHNDDETLFGAYTIIREKPLVVVVTDSWIQFNRGEKCTADERWEETVSAMAILGAPVYRIGLRDDIVYEDLIKYELSKFRGFDEVFAPAIQGGNIHHDEIAKVAKEIWPNVTQYTTYTKTELWTSGNREIVPTEYEKEIKNRALQCYKSQLGINAPHFEAVKGKSEWII